MSALSPGGQRVRLQRGWQSNADGKWMGIPVPRSVQSAAINGDLAASADFRLHSQN